LDEPEETSIADGLCGLDLIHPVIEGCPGHAVELVDGTTNAAVGSKMSAALERLTDGAVIRALPLGVVGQTMGLAGGEDPATGWLVALGDKNPTTWADPPPALAAQRLGPGRQLHGVVMVGGLTGAVVRGGVRQADPAALVAHMGLVRHQTFKPITGNKSLH